MKRDHFQELLAAVGQLKNCLEHMNVHLDGITLKPGVDLTGTPAGVAFSCAIKASPSFALMTRASDMREPKSYGILAEVMGVRISVR